MDDAFIGEIRVLPYSYCPEDWFPCDGRTLAASQYGALYSVIGNSFGGDALTFKLPNLAGLVMMGAGAGPGLTPREIAQTGGSETAPALTTAQIPAHNHQVHAWLPPSTGTSSATPSSDACIGHSVAPSAQTFVLTTDGPHRQKMDPRTLGPAGAPNPAPHENRQPYLVLTYGICWNGEYPVRP